MSRIDADNRHFGEAAFMNETEERAVASDAGEKVLVTGKFLGYFITEFLYQREEFIVSYSRSVFLITEHVYLHFALSVCYNNLSEYGI